jgi:hypothetical protein
MTRMAELRRAEGDEGGFRDAVRRADNAGSMWAAAASVDLAQADGVATAAGEALSRVRERAQRADRAGSAEAAVLLAQLAEHEGDQVASLAAWRRADSRGAVAGTLGLAQALLQSGDLDAAEAATRRAEDAGDPRASYLLMAIYLSRRRRKDLLAAIYLGRRLRKEWYRAVLRAAEEAGSRGDAATLRLAMQVLHPYGPRWWRAHRLLASVLVTVLALVGVWAGWRCAVAIGALLVAFALSQRPIVPSTPRVMPEVEKGLALAGLTASVTLGGPDLFPPRLKPRRTRAATRRDHVYWRGTVAVPALAAGVSLGWASGLFGGGVMIRVLFGALAVLTLVFFAWQWPHVGAAEPDPAPRPGADDRVTISLAFAPRFFWWMYFTFFITNPALKSLVERSMQRAARRAPRSRLMVRLQWAAAPLTVAAVLTTLAVVPGQRHAVEDTAGLVGMAIEAIVIVYGLGRAWKHAHRAILDSDLLGVAAAVGYVLVLGALAFVAYQLGLFGPWRKLFA